MIRKAVIPTAGLGTRLLSATKELPKEMLPVFYKNNNGEYFLKPLLQVLFEQLYKSGFREFCFIVGRGKRAVEDHFTPDFSFLKNLKNKGKRKYVEILEEFYSMIENSTIVWINQPEPLGFGHAVYLSKPFVKDDSFLVAAGDTYIAAENNKHIKELINFHLNKKSAATVLLQEVKNPKEYGVALINKNERKVTKLIEKPKEEISKLAILPIYIFEPVIFNAIESTEKGYGGEIQLTDAIQKLITWGLNVQYILLDKNEIRLDIGNPNYYYEALKISFEKNIWK